jgi:glutamate decarboxylase
MVAFSGISILAHLWHAPFAQQAIGTATTGSSEAIQLGGLAMKRIWQEKRKASGKSIHDPGPNIVMGANAQVALEKFARYFEAECRLVPTSLESHYRLDPKKAMECVDENTIGVFVILGSKLLFSSCDVYLLHSPRKVPTPVITSR